MPALRNYVIKDSRGNTVGIHAVSETQARSTFQRMMPSAKIASCEEKGRVSKQVRSMLKSRSFRPVGPVKRNKGPGPNKPCPCKSGKKYKKCCGRRRQR